MDAVSQQTAARADADSERRNGPRVSVSRAALVEPLHLDGRPETGSVIDLSARGLRIRVAQVEPVGTALRIELAPQANGGGPWLLEGVVVRATPLAPTAAELGVRLRTPRVRRRCAASERPCRPHRLPEPRQSVIDSSPRVSPAEFDTRPPERRRAERRRLLRTAALTVLCLLLLFRPAEPTKRRGTPHDVTSVVRAGIAAFWTRQEASAPSETSTGRERTGSAQPDARREGLRRRDPELAGIGGVLDRTRRPWASSYRRLPAYRQSRAPVLLASVSQGLSGRVRAIAPTSGQPLDRHAQTPAADPVQDRRGHGTGSCSRGLLERPAYAGGSSPLVSVDSPDRPMREPAGRTAPEPLDYRAHPRGAAGSLGAAGGSGDVRSASPIRRDSLAATPLEPPEPVAALVVQKGARTMTLTVEGIPVRSWPIGIGRDDRTPEGLFTVGKRIPRPDWYNRGESVPYGDARNPLGDYWIGLSDSAGPTPFGIHPTDDATSIGAAAGMGCIRMRPDDAEEVYALCEPGMLVRIEP